MKTKQHLLFAALLISCVGAGSLASCSFNGANISNSRTILNAQESAPSFVPGKLANNVSCTVTDISYATGSVSIGLDFNIIADEDGSETNSIQEYALAYLKDDTFVKEADFNCELPKLKYTVKKADGSTEVRYGDILKSTIVGEIKFDIVGSTEETTLGDPISTKCVIKDFDKENLEILTDEFKVFNLYAFSTDAYKGEDVGLLKDSEDETKFDRYYCDAVYDEKRTQINKIEDFVNITLNGASTYSGIGALSFNVQNIIQPNLTQYRLDVMNKELELKGEEVASAKADFDEVAKTATQFDKVNPTSEYNYYKTIYNGLKQEHNVIKSNINNVETGIYKVRAYINLAATNYNTVYYEDGSTATYPCKQTFFEITKPNNNFVFFNEKLNRRDILAIEPDSFELKIRIFDVGINSEGKQNNIFQESFDISHIFSSNKFVVKDATYTSDFGDSFTLKSNVDNPYYIDCNLGIIIGLSTLIIVYEAISVIVFFYLKNKNKDDIFKRVRPKQYWKTNTVGLITCSVVFLALISIIFRSTCIHNTAVVTNPIDVLIVAFSIASIIFIGYFVRYFAIQIKNIQDKRKNEKLQLNKNSADDGTISLSNDK